MAAIASFEFRGQRLMFEPPIEVPVLPVEMTLGIVAAFGALSDQQASQALRLGQGIEKTFHAVGQERVVHAVRAVLGKRHTVTAQKIRRSE